MNELGELKEKVDIDSLKEKVVEKVDVEGLKDKAQTVVEKIRDAPNTD